MHEFNQLEVHGIFVEDNPLTKPEPVWYGPWAEVTSALYVQKMVQTGGETPVTLHEILVV